MHNLASDIVGAESMLLRGMVENVRVLSAASFFLGTALGACLSIFGSSISSFLISLNSATSFLIDVAQRFSQIQFNQILYCIKLFFKLPYNEIPPLLFFF